MDFVLIGEAAARLHGAPLDIEVIEIVADPFHTNLRRLERSRDRLDAGAHLITSNDDFDRWRRSSEPLPWLPDPGMRVMNRWLDAPSGHVASLWDLIQQASPDRVELLKAVQEELDRTTRGFRVHRRTRNRADRFDGAVPVRNQHIR